MGEIKAEEVGRMIKTMKKYLRKDPGTWAILLTTNTREARPKLKSAGFEAIAIAERRNISLSIKVGEQGRMTEEKDLARKLHRLEGPKGNLKVKTIPENLVKAVASEELEDKDWEKIREDELAEALQWMDSPQTGMGVAPGNSTQKMMDAGIQERTAEN